MLQIIFLFVSNEIPALMTKGSVPPDTALVQSTPVLAVLGKLVLLQTIAVLCTDRGVQRGVKGVAGLVAHRPDLLFSCFL